MKIGDLVKWSQVGPETPHRTSSDVGMIVRFCFYGRPIIVWQSGWQGTDHGLWGEFFSQIDLIHECG